MKKSIVGPEVQLGMQSVVKRVRHGSQWTTADRRGTVMEERRGTIVEGEKPAISPPFVVPKVGCAGAKDAVNEMNENILRSEAMYAAEEIINAMLSTSSRRQRPPQYATLQREPQYSPPSPEPATSPIFSPQAAVAPGVDYSQSILMRPRTTEYPYQIPPYDIECDVQDVTETMDDILYKMQVVQGEVEALGNTCCFLLEESKSKEKELRALVGELETLRKEKADEELMYDLLETKADTNEVFDKLSHADFTEALEELSNGMMKAVHLICRQEIMFKDAIDIILWEVGRKLNRFELQPIRDIVNTNLKKLYKRVKNIENMKRIALAAATRRHLKTKDICLSCDTDALLKECKNIPIPIAPGFIPHTNVKPFLTYQMDRIRKNPLRTKICTRYCGGSHTLMYRHGHLGRRVYVDYPCPPDSELKPGKRPKRQRGPKKIKKPSIDPESLKDMLWNSVVDRLDTQQSYQDAPKIRDPYRKMKIATKLLIVDPDIASIDSLNIPSYKDTLWQLSEIDPRNPVLIDHLPIKVGQHGVYYPVPVYTTTESGQHVSVPTTLSQPAKTTDPLVAVAPFEQQQGNIQVKPILSKRSSENLRQSLELHSTLEFKGRSDYQHRVTELISKRPSFRLPTKDESATGGQTKHTFLGSRASARRETIMQYGGRKSGPRTSEHRTSEHRTSEHRTSEHRTSEHRTSEHRTSEHRTSEHRTSEHRTSEHGMSGHRTSEQRPSGSRLSGSLHPPTEGGNETNDIGDYRRERTSSLERDLKSKTLKVDHVSQARRTGIKNAGTGTVW